MHGYRRYFTDTVTIYHKTVDPVTKDDVLERVVVPAVMARWHTERTVDSSGVVKVAQSLSVTVLPDTDPGELMQPGSFGATGRALRRYRPSQTTGASLTSSTERWNAYEDQHEEFC